MANTVENITLDVANRLEPKTRETLERLVPFFEDLDALGEVAEILADYAVDSITTAVEVLSERGVAIQLV
jgi:hypothetical protein